jgi:hypothetical protein
VVLMILRHEAGHAIENAYKLRQRPKRQAIFGRAPSPTRQLRAQALQPQLRRAPRLLVRAEPPDEDFAETFAVWLTPDSNWRERYQGWPALRKLEYVDALMRQIAGRARRSPRGARRSRSRRSGARCASTTAGSAGTTASTPATLTTATCARSSRTLPSTRATPPAAPFLTRIRREVRNRVRRWTGERLYVIDQVLGDMVRAAASWAAAARAEDEARLEFTTLLTARTMTHLQLGRHRVPL